MASTLTRRDFVKGTALTAATAVTGPLIRSAMGQPSRYGLNVGVIGCGGRGTGAAINMLEADPDTQIVALADVFPDRLESCRKHLESHSADLRERIRISDARCYSGFDAYRMLLEQGDVDVVILTTPPHFRPMHLRAAIERGKHAFIEKPVAVDPVGVRSVIASGELAQQKRLSIVAGTQRRHETCYLEAMKRLHHDEIGEIVAASCYWLQGGLWMHARQPQYTDMEWQLRNWLYFTWLSGDMIVEQHMHNIDVINWAIGSTPLKAMAMGGREVRTSTDYGNVFDHFAVEYEYPEGQTMLSMCRQIDGCAGRVEEVIRGTKGTCTMSSGRAKIAFANGADPWIFTGENNNPYVQEHADLIGSIKSGTPLNEARQVAESTLTAIMGRMSAYTGKVVTWEQAMTSGLDLSPQRYEMGELTVADVPVPGRTPLV